MGSTFNRLAYGRIAALRLVVTYLVGISVGAVIAVALLAVAGAPSP